MRFLQSLVVSTILWCLFTLQIVSAETLKAGIILPLSGGVSEYGVAFKNGVQLALDENKKINHRVTFVFEDSQYDNKLAISGFQKLIASDKCQLVFVWGSGPSEALAPLAERQSFPLITLGEHDAAVGRSHVLTFTNPSTQFSEMLVRYLTKQGYKKFAIVMTQITYFETLSNTFRDNLNPDQSLSIVNTHLPGDNDFKSSIAKIVKDKPDALGVYLLNGQVSAFYRQMAEQRLEIPTFGTDVFESATEIKASAPRIEGAVYAHNLVSEDFKKRYREKYHNDIHLTTAARGYDFANLVGDTADPLLPELGRNIFEKLTKIEGSKLGASGEYRFKSSAQFGKRFEFPIVVKKIVNGKVTIVRE